MFEPEKYQFGVKIINLDSFLKPEEYFSTIKSEDFILPIYQTKLEEYVPIEVKQLYDVARGTIAYAYFFYPLMSLGTEQLFRVAETAITIKCEQLKAPIGVRNFERAINWLVSKQRINKELEKQWLDIKDLRNLSSHPTQQQIISKPIALSLLQTITTLINSLFNIS